MTNQPPMTKAQQMNAATIAAARALDEGVVGGLPAVAARYTAWGYTIVSYTPEQLILRQKNAVAVHVILAIITAGLWLIPWVIYLAVHKPHQIVFRANPDGTASIVR